MLTQAVHLLQGSTAHQHALSWADFLLPLFENAEAHESFLPSRVPALITVQLRQGWACCRQKWRGSSSLARQKSRGPPRECPLRSSNGSSSNGLSMAWGTQLNKAAGRRAGGQAGGRASRRAGRCTQAPAPPVVSNAQDEVRPAAERNQKVTTRSGTSCTLHAEWRRFPSPIDYLLGPQARSPADSATHQ